MHGATRKRPCTHANQSCIARASTKQSKDQERRRVAGARTGTARETERVTCFGLLEQSADRLEELANGYLRTPSIPKNVHGGAAIVAVDVGVVHLGLEIDLGGSRRVVLGE